MTTVAVVGLGAMGSRIARLLLEHDHEVVVWNRDASKAAPLKELGAITVETPAAAARRAEIIFTVVRDPSALRDVTEGPTGVAAGANGLATVIQMSTVDPASVERLASVLTGRAELLDAPVLGSVTEAESGTLTIFVGGPPLVVERSLPLLSVLGSPLHVGPVGAGTAAKLVANSTLFGVLGVLGEALALADALGIARDVAFDVLAATPLAGQAERRRQSIETGAYPPRFALSLARKDADLIVGAAAASGTDVRLAASARSWLAEAEEAGDGDRDYSAVLARILTARA